MEIQQPEEEFSNTDIRPAYKHSEVCFLLFILYLILRHYTYRLLNGLNVNYDWKTTYHKARKYFIYNEGISQTRERLLLQFFLLEFNARINRNKNENIRMEWIVNTGLAWFIRHGPIKFYAYFLMHVFCYFRENLGMNMLVVK